MFGLTREEWIRLRNISGFLIALMFGLVLLYGVFGKEEVLVLPAAVLAVVGIMAGCCMYIATTLGNRRITPIMIISAMVVPLAVAVGAGLAVYVLSMF